MQPPAPHLTLDRITLAIAILAISGLVTAAEVMGPSLSFLQLSAKKDTSSQAAPEPVTPSVEPSNATVPTSGSVPSPTTSTPSQPAAAASAAAVATPPAAKTPTATTVSFVHVRAGKGTNTPVLFDLEGGVAVELRNDSDPQWQGIRYNGQNAYIYKSYLQY
jgi:hypothetical protein